MVYAEWLRVRGALKRTAIVLGVMVVLVLAMRIVLYGLQHSVEGRIAQMQADPGSRTTHSVQPDGARRTAIDDPAAQTHVLVDDYGWGHKHIVIEDRSSRPHSKLSVVNGSIHTEALPSGQGTSTIVDTDEPVPFGGFAICGVIVALILATLLGPAFARENDGHLEFAFTKPVSRLVLGVTTIGIDGAGIAAGFVLGVFFAMLCTLTFGLPHVTFSATDFLTVVLGLVGPLSWYAMLNAATASLKRGHGAIVGFAWPAALIVVALTFVPVTDNVILNVVHWLASVIAFINPVYYMHFSTVSAEVNNQPLVHFSGGTPLAALLALLVGYGALAIFEWTRVEA